MRVGSVATKEIYNIIIIRIYKVNISYFKYKYKYLNLNDRLISYNIRVYYLYIKY